MIRRKLIRATLTNCRDTPERRNLKGKGQKRVGKWEWKSFLIFGIQCYKVLQKLHHYTSCHMNI